MSDKIFDDDVVFAIALRSENLADPIANHHPKNNSTFSSHLLRAPVALEITSGPRLDHIRKVLQSSRAITTDSRLIETDQSHIIDESTTVPKLTNTPNKSGIATASAQSGDIVVDITGHRTCFVLRRVATSVNERMKKMRSDSKERRILDFCSPFLSSQSFRLVGDSYLGVPVEVPHGKLIRTAKAKTLPLINSALFFLGR